MCQCQGGGLDNQGTLTLTDCTVNGNTSETGGGISNEGTLTLTNCTVSRNSTMFIGNGGGISNEGTLTLTNCTVSSNTSETGGGISNEGTLTLTNCTVSSNSTPFALGNGGGLDNQGTLTLTDCTVNGNTSETGGGISNEGTLTLTNCTVSSNSTVSYFRAFGGGIANQGTLTLTNCTVSSNSAMVGLVTGGGGIGSTTGTVALTNTIVASNEISGILSTVEEQDIQGTVTTSSHNLIGVDSGLSGITNGVNGNLVGTLDSPINPRLGPLQNNGGPTSTMALLLGSPAIDAGVAVRGVTTDQRGIPRPQGIAPDIGAFEDVGPTVLSVQRHGVHYQLTTLIVTFNRPMDAASAEDLANYRLVSAGPDHRFGTRDDRAVRIRTIQYDAAARTVTIRPAHRLPLRRRFQLTILGTPPTGLKDTAGFFLDGAGTGQEGTNYVIVISDKLLVPPIIHKAEKQAALVHGPRPR